MFKEPLFFEKNASIGEYGKMGVQKTIKNTELVVIFPELQLELISSTNCAKNLLRTLFAGK